MRRERLIINSKFSPKQTLAQLQHQHFKRCGHMFGRDPTDLTSFPASGPGQIQAKTFDTKRRTDSAQFIDAPVPNRETPA